MSCGELDSLIESIRLDKWKQGQQVCQTLDDGKIKLGTIDGSAFKCKVGVLQRVKWEEGCIGFIYTCHLRELVV